MELHFHAVLIICRRTDEKSLVQDSVFWRDFARSRGNRLKIKRYQQCYFVNYRFWDSAKIRSVCVCQSFPVFLPCNPSSWYHWRTVFWQDRERRCFLVLWFDVLKEDYDTLWCITSARKETIHQLCIVISIQLFQSILILCRVPLRCRLKNKRDQVLMKRQFQGRKHSSTLAAVSMWIQAAKAVKIFPGSFCRFVSKQNAKYSQRAWIGII